MKAPTPTATPLCSHRGWRLSIPVVTTYTISGTKAALRHAPSLSSSSRQMRSVGLTLTTRGTARSDEHLGSFAQVPPRWGLLEVGGRDVGIPVPACFEMNPAWAPSLDGEGESTSILL